MSIKPGELQLQIMSRPEALKRAKQSAIRALTLDPENTTAHRVLASIHLYQRQYEDAIQLATKAVELSPNDAASHITLAYILVSSGEPYSAKSTLKTGLRLEPRPAPHKRMGIGWTWFRLQEYEKTVVSFTTALRDRPDIDTVWTSLPLAASYAYLGQRKKARAEVIRIRAAWPTVNYSYFEPNLKFLRRKEDAEHQIEGFRRAGIPKWPHAFEGNEENRLTGSEIKSLLYGNRIYGYARVVDKFEMDFDERGNWQFRNHRHEISGQSYISNNLLCRWSKNLVRGESMCEPVYRNPDGTREQKNEYIYPGIFNIKKFSVVK